MGQTQLLLVILGIILVGVAIFVGIQLFQHNSVDDVRNSVMTDLNSYAARALAYYGKPTTQGGGNKSFDGVTMSMIFPSSENVNGRYYIESAEGDNCVIVGVGNAVAGEDSVRIRIRVTPDRNTIEIIN
jgi:hypothetical protein